MSYSIIQQSRKKLREYKNEYLELQDKINLYLNSLSHTTFDVRQRREFWESILKYIEDINRKVQIVLTELNNTHFAENEIILQEEKEAIMQNGANLLVSLRKEKETVSRQIERKADLIAPWHQKNLNKNYCYFCDRDISQVFAYEIREKDQRVTGVAVAPGAKFCSSDCLIDYCKEYKKWESTLQEKEKEIENKIKNYEQIITEFQKKVSSLIQKINELEEKERNLELSLFAGQHSEPQPGFWGRLGKKMGMVKDKDPRTTLQKIKKRKTELKAELEEINEKQRKTLLRLSSSEQEKQKLNESTGKLLHGKENHASEEDEDY